LLNGLDFLLVVVFIVVFKATPSPQRWPFSVNPRNATMPNILQDQGVEHFITFTETAESLV